MRSEKPLMAVWVIIALAGFPSLSRATESNRVTERVLIQLAAENHATISLYYFGTSSWRGEWATLDFRNVRTYRGPALTRRSLLERLGLRHPPAALRLMRSQYEIIQSCWENVAGQKPLGVWGPMQDLYRSVDGVIIAWDRRLALPVMVHSPNLNTVDFLWPVRPAVTAELQAEHPSWLLYLALTGQLWSDAPSDVLAWARAHKLLGTSPAWGVKEMEAPPAAVASPHERAETAERGDENIEHVDAERSCAVRRIVDQYAEELKRLTVSLETAPTR